MKRINKLFLAGLAVAALTGCRPDLLDTKPYDGFSSESMWQDESSCEMGVTGIYRVLRTLYTETGMDQNAKAYLWQLMDPTTTWRDNSSGFLNNTATSADEFASTLWKRYYEGVSRANDAIDNLGEAPISATSKGKLLAEAKFLRAFYYYNLNCLYRGVPLYLTSVTSDEAKTYSRSTETQVWEAVIADLTDCINEANLPDRYEAGSSEYGRITKGAAYALRGKVYLWMKDWAKAAADFSAVHNCGYDLFTTAGAQSYKQLFKEANEQCPEMIFSVQCIDMDGWGNSLNFRYGARSIFDKGGGWTTYQVSTDFLDSYQNADGTPFNWDDVIPGYTSMDVKDREVFFLRDTDTEVLRARFQAIGYTGDIDKAIETIKASVDARLQNLSAEAQAKYLPSGNEERIKQAYANRDPRLQMSVITPYSTYEGAENEVANTFTMRWPYIAKDESALFDLRSDMIGYLYPLHRKFVAEGMGEASSRYQSPIDIPLIRYADVLLGWAEALNEQGQWQEAMEKVNQIRNRAGVGALTTAMVSGQDDLRKRIQQERRWELVGEGVDYYDELRCKTWKESKFNDNNPANPAGFKQCWGLPSFTYTWGGDKYYVWPIPKQEIEMNANLTQNDGWEK